MSFLTDVEAQAKQESERVIKELTQLKFDAQQVIHILNALKLEVPKELRELSPIEVVPPVIDPRVVDVLESIPRESITEAAPKERGRKRGPTSLQKKAENKYQAIRSSLLEMLKKGPMLKGDILKQFETGEFSSYLVEQAFRRMKKDREIDYRTVGFQGPTEWFLPSRPITLETLRDEVVKTEGLVQLGALAEKFGFKKIFDLNEMLMALHGHGVLVKKGDGLYYEKPKGKVYKGIVEHERTKNFGGGVNGVSGDKISSDKMVRELVARIKNQGAQVKKTGSHISVSFAGHHTIIGSTPNAGGFKQDRENLKKMGLRV